MSWGPRDWEGNGRGRVGDGGEKVETRSREGALHPYIAPSFIVIDTAHVTNAILLIIIMIIIIIFAQSQQ